mgnify:CR=1 FL=1
MPLPNLVTRQQIRKRKKRARSNPYHPAGGNIGKADIQRLLRGFGSFPEYFETVFKLPLPQMERARRKRKAE